MTTLVVLSAGAALTPGSANSPLGAAIVSVAGLLNARSPGTRTEAELIKSKQRERRSGSPGGPLTERVRGKVFPPVTDVPLVATPEEFLGQYFPADLGPELPDFGVGELGGAPPEYVGFKGTSGSGSSGGSGGGGGGSSGGGSGGGSGGQPPLPPAQIPAVPEPSTWALMLMGAAMCGAVMRRQKSIQLKTRVA